jgi:thiamine-monophosphate kinase
VDLRGLGEFGLIEQIARWTPRRVPGLVKGIGDDVAVIRTEGQKCLLATTDLLVEGIDFHRSWADPYLLGKKALAVNLSDIAAMGGTPRFYLVSLGLPPGTPLPFVSSLYRGLKAASRRYRVHLAGGDLSRSRKILINICLLGEGKKEDLLFRSGARPGDDLYVSGTLGDSALGLKLLRKKGLPSIPRGLRERHLSPIPRIELGQAISRGRVATAMIDISDGLLLDTSHLLQSSRVGGQIWEECIPLSRLYLKYIGSKPAGLYRLALSGGEDYELLFTAPPEKRERVLSLSTALKTRISRIGKILPRSSGLHILDRTGREVSPSRLGFEHFR